MSKIERIAILGANSQIALDYIELALEKTERELYLYSRNPQLLKTQLDARWKLKFTCIGYDEFPKNHYDLIINFVGGSDPALLSQIGEEIFAITDQYDGLAIDYLKKHKKCKYIFISSGAAYGNRFALGPVSETVKPLFNFDKLATSDYYGAAKYLAEQRHRTQCELNITDVRIFSYFSKRQNLNSKLFLAQAINALKNAQEFVTSNEQIWRDYIGPEDFYCLIECIIKHSDNNISVDCFTKDPVSKFELIELLKNNNLNIRVISSIATTKEVDKSKKYYYSSMRQDLSLMGYTPIFSSLQGIENQFSHFKDGRVD